MSFALAYDRIAARIVEHCGGADKFAHTYTGLAIWLFVIIVVRRHNGPALGLLAVIVLELGNECVDRVAHGSWMWSDTLTDIASTWFWPALLTGALVCVPARAWGSGIRARPRASDDIRRP